MPKAEPAEFRRDVVAIASPRESSQKQIAKDFGISEATLDNWVKPAEIAEGGRRGATVRGVNGVESVEETAAGR